jgi:uncharacterized protein YlzI (FlbEa/FlbD family)
MKANDILNKIKGIVGEKTELSDEKIAMAEIKLENGTVLTAEKFEEGEAVFIKTEDKEVALPLGEYELEDGKKLIVKEEGLIDSIVEKVKEEAEEVPVEAKEETEETELGEEEKEEMKYVTKEELGKAVEEIKAMIEEKLGDKKEKKEEMKEELSAVAPEPIKHNPESSSKQKFKIQYSQNRVETTKDRVMSKIFQNN